MEKDTTFCPIQCAEEVVKVLEKHKISVLHMEKVFEIAKDIAITNTKIQSK